MHIESAHAQLPFHCKDIANRVQKQQVHLIYFAEMQPILLKDIVFGGNTQKSCRFSLEHQVFWLILFVFVPC